ncbi:TerC/Alx family metal homeostasis membrane protein [Mariniflexile gromovii]|uniref:TerC/Alx family metal homeostasis membrane protein n=1 Tax=Mariniflexile gromovii TaxID=362523 RepID=A0ABS4BXQ5_9FLAO|nr:TerC/Alx family metal homeostasis membrane protein [Mariniflexile gromovii]MBP0905362.1 TerC/Alx family metal homeostasis membrane protein [Mariniflexile gromovii]
MASTTPWIVLIVYVLVLLFIDFFVLHKKNKTPSVKKAILEVVFFVSNALVFSGVLYWCYSHNLVANINNLSATDALIKYLTGYIIELSLSVDNLFVIAIIFTSFKIPSQYQHKLLFLGILGAIVFRAILISVGLVLINKIHGMNIVFGLFLLFTALKMLKKEAEHTEFDEPKGYMKYFRFSNVIDGGKFVTRVNGKRVFTALFGALLTIEFTDLLFALDSIPAIFAVTTDPFIVYSSNIFAIMGLRSLYFFLANMLERFVYLKYSVFAILVFVSIKLITASWVEIPEWFSLLFIGLSLGIGVYVSASIGNHKK